MNWEVKNVLRHEEKGGDWRDGLTPQEIEVAEEASRLGIISSMGQALQHSATSPPRSLEKFFLGFLRLARPKKIPAFAMERFNEDYGFAPIVFYSANGIGLLVHGGVIKQFFPLNYIMGVGVRSVGDGTSRARLDADQGRFSEWMRGRMGYVPGNARAFYSAMQKRTIGEFARNTGMN